MPSRGGIALGSARPVAPSPAPTQQAAAAAPAPTPAQAAATPAPTAQKAVPPISTTPSSGGSHVQLAAPNTPQGAEQTAQAMAKKHVDLLGGVGHEIQRFEDNRGVFYRVLFGPLANKAEAAKLCESFKGRNQGCIVR
jgi:cell division protein FtsN